MLKVVCINIYSVEERSEPSPTVVSAALREVFRISKERVVNLVDSVGDGMAGVVDDGGKSSLTNGGGGDGGRVGEGSSDGTGVGQGGGDGAGVGQGGGVGERSGEGAGVGDGGGVSEGGGYGEGQRSGAGGCATLGTTPGSFEFGEVLSLGFGDLGGVLDGEGSYSGIDGSYSSIDEGDWKVVGGYTESKSIGHIVGTMDLTVMGVQVAVASDLVTVSVLKHHYLLNQSLVSLKVI
jgi:hypothetical protein